VLLPLLIPPKRLAVVAVVHELLVAARLVLVLRKLPVVVVVAHLAIHRRLTTTTTLPTKRPVVVEVVAVMADRQAIVCSRHKPRLPTLPNKRLWIRSTAALPAFVTLLYVETLRLCCVASTRTHHHTTTAQRDLDLVALPRRTSAPCAHVQLVCNRSLLVLAVIRSANTNSQQQCSRSVNPSL
jgi:hypothetical protein